VAIDCRVSPLPSASPHVFGNHAIGRGEVVYVDTSAYPVVCSKEEKKPSDYHNLLYFAV